MGMQTTMRANANARMDEASIEALNEKTARADRFRSKWEKVPEIGSGLKAMSESKARRLAIYLENQARAMSKLTEATYSSAFAA